MAHRCVLHAGTGRAGDPPCGRRPAGERARRRRDRVRRSMRAAYDALSDAMKGEIDGRVAEHDVFWSRRQIGFTEFPPGEREQYPPSRQRLVRRHPGSHRKTLYLSAHASHIVGWPVPEGRLLLLDLNTHATQPEFVYSHKWRIGDLVIWDNRCTMHRGRPHDDSYPRDLRRATTLDIGSTLDEAA